MGNGRLLISVLEKNQLVLLDRSNNTGVINVKMGGSILEEKTYFKMLRLPFSSRLDWASYIISITKTASRKIGVVTHSMNFVSPEVVQYLYHTALHGILLSCLDSRS